MTMTANKQTMYILLAVAIAVLVGIWFWTNPQISKAPEGTSMQNASDTTASINHDLNAVVVDDPDYTSIDADLNSL